MTEPLEPVEPLETFEPRDAGPLAATHTGTHRRVALFADVHGNRPALQAAVSAAQAAGADAHFYLGCLTWGPAPREVFALAERADVPVFFLRGNGERAAIELGSGQRSPVGDVDEWMVPAHGPELLARLAGLPAALTATVDGLGTVRLCHGSPRSDVELLTPGTSADRIGAACAGTTEDIVVHGHTHLQYSRASAGRRIVGCGSVGLPYTEQPGAAYWTLIDASGVHPQRTPVDLEEAAAFVRSTGYPAAERYVGQLLSPPTPAEIVADAEAKLFSD